jgi:hypothetical protein
MATGYDILDDLTEEIVPRADLIALRDEITGLLDTARQKVMLWEDELEYLAEAVEAGDAAALEQLADFHKIHE